MQQTATKNQFYAYEAVRRSGVTNMWDFNTARQLISDFANEGIDKDTYLDIIRDYASYKEEYSPFPDWIDDVANEIQEAEMDEIYDEDDDLWWEDDEDDDWEENEWEEIEENYGSEN